MDSKKNINEKALIILPEVHTSVEEAKEAEEKARQERMHDQRAEKHAHQEANIIKDAIKQELENKKK
ncbi:hypothetical protein RclHR1_03300007 [Rhizophagus clarus]|uniref:Uncharacterized protein n=1 Tax=Rhizophagus clarus TaxID=94130 RepID=A0A2Z6R8Q4_9GLOM|nr:hypothetical protein RclHR1_03300007 [Rhizophagus clarus]GES77090.1 hypothetical protein RCL_jg25975.t1 [Rhizophagus clarus]